MVLNNRQKILKQEFEAEVEKEKEKEKES